MEVYVYQKEDNFFIFTETQHTEYVIQQKFIKSKIEYIGKIELIKYTISQLTKYKYEKENFINSLTK